jgi:magnesium-transporting ATPase (P-type)
MNLKNTFDKKHWQAYNKEEIFSELRTSGTGLKKEEVNKRILFYGENKLPQGQKTSLLQIILHQLLNPLIFILIAAAVASIAIGEEKDALFIFLVIFINSALGAYQEYNAEKSASSLRN